MSDDRAVSDRTEVTATAEDLRDAAEALRFWPPPTHAHRLYPIADRLEASSRLEPATTALIEAALEWTEPLDSEAIIHLWHAVRAYRAALASEPAMERIADGRGAGYPPEARRG